MIIREISKKNIIEILIFPLIFALIFFAGLYALIELKINNYFAYAGWCTISGLILFLIIFFYVYRTLSVRPKQAIQDPRMVQFYYNAQTKDNLSFPNPNPYGVHPMKEMNFHGTKPDPKTANMLNDKPKKKVD